MKDLRKPDRNQLQQIYKKQKLNMKETEQQQQYPRIYQNSGDSELILGDLKILNLKKIF